MSRTEAFLKYAEEHPGEVLAAIDDKTDALIREVQEQERQARRDLLTRRMQPDGDSGRFSHEQRG